MHEMPFEIRTPNLHCKDTLSSAQIFCVDISLQRRDPNSGSTLMAISPSTLHSTTNPTFISAPFPPRPRPRYLTYQRCAVTCRATKDDQNDGTKRDSIAEWVARARSQGRARRARASNASSSSNSSNRAGAASALDAVDRLFGGNDSASTDTPPLRYSGQGQIASEEQRKQWLSDLRRAGSRPREQSVEDEDIVVKNPAISSARRKVSRPRGRPQRTSASKNQLVDEELDEGFAQAAIYDDQVDEDDSNDEEGVDDQIIMPSSTIESSRNRKSRKRSTVVDSVNDKYGNSTNRSSRARPRSSTSRRSRSINTSSPDNNHPGEEEFVEDYERNLSSSHVSRSGRTRSSARISRRRNSNATKGTNTATTSFSRLLEIARNGGTSESTRSRKPDFESIHEAMSDLEQTTPTSNRNRRRPSKKIPTDGPIRQLFQMSRSTSASDARKALVFDDEEAVNIEEEAFDNGSRTLRSIGIKVPEKQETRRKYSTTRRVGGRVRKIHSPPADWGPMTNNEIANIRSDKTPLVPRRSIGAEPVRDCPECYGTGLEMCSVCVGTGWVEPVQRERQGTKGTKREALVRRVWEQPNLCISSDGSAQCPYCNGIGKSFCSTCEGSGSALRKGFDPADKYIAYDMFQGETPSSLDREDFEIIDDDAFVEVTLGGEEKRGREEEEEEEEEEEDLIYSGTPNAFEFTLPHLEHSALDLTNKTSAVDDEYEEPEFEFSNGVHDEEHTDFGSKPQRRPLLKRVRSFKDDYIPFSDDRAIENESVADNVRLAKSKSVRTSETNEDEEDDIALIANDLDDDIDDDDDDDDDEEDDDEVELESGLLDVEVGDVLDDEDDDDDDDLEEAELDDEDTIELDDTEFLGVEDEDDTEFFDEGDDIER